MKKFVFFLFLSSVSCGSDKVTEYKNLITENILKATQYQLPVDNRRFFGNELPNVTHYFGHYDFIIVGAGSAGTVVANRLSEIKSWRVLLIEAGGEETDVSDIPTMMYFTHLSPMNWGYNTTSQTTCCLGMVNNQCTFPRGRVIGGSSTINALMYIRGNKEDYDNWSAQGNPGWSYNEILEYFIKSEHSNIIGDNKYHGQFGPLDVSYFDPPGVFTSNFVDANLEMNNNYVDYNGKDQMGFSRLQINIKNGKRASGGRAFIDPIKNRKNLKIITNSLATKILFSKIYKIAYGIQFLQNGILYEAFANKEIILSAGAINTPQLLMVSGIGPKKELEKLNINPINNLPVGKNLQDHAAFVGLNFRTNFTFDAPSLDDQIRDYFNGTGMLTYASNTQAVGYISTSKNTRKAPNIEYFIIPPVSSSRIAQLQYNTDEKITKSFIDNINRLTDFRIYVVHLHPKSKGSVTLKSKSILDFPEIDINYFSDKDNDDIEAMYEGIQYILKLVNTSSFQAINATLEMEVPPCDREEKNSRDYWYCVIRHLSSTLYHPTGTTRMGPSRSSAVVNHKLQVYDTRRLRIADCGVIPEITSGHTNAPAFMIGEKISDIIKKQYL